MDRKEQQFLVPQTAARRLANALRAGIVHGHHASLSVVLEQGAGDTWHVVSFTSA
jgi:hypothetical protein